MKRTILLMAITLLISAATAIVGGPEPGEGEMAIMSSGSSASATSAVGPNGTKWSSSVKMAGRNTNIADGDRVENITYSESETTFSGQIQAPTPCHVIDHEVEKLGDQSYSMNIQTVKDDLDNESQVCTQQVVMIKYDGSFEDGAPYSLEIQHNNETVDTLENNVDDTEEPSGGMFDNFFSWLGHLF
jgi:hypothetical protein